jgi:hypothetical protein
MQNGYVGERERCQSRGRHNAVNALDTLGVTNTRPVSGLSPTRL